VPLYARTLLLTGPLSEVEAARPAHLAQLRELETRGRLRAAGEFRDGDGFLEIFEAHDLLEAQAISEASPLVALGLGACLLREWVELEPGGGEASGQAPSTTPTSGSIQRP
jgi:uncharacterized protein YciI